MSRLQGRELQAVYATLLRCGPFKNADTLKAVFNDARIAVWRRWVPDTAGNEQERAEALLAALREQYNRDGRNVFVLFLRVLADRHSGADSCHSDLTALADELADELNREPTVPTGIANKFIIPFPMNYEFYGRERDLERLHSALQKQDSHIVGIRPIAGLTGMGGIGKTQLAVVYSYQHKGDYAGGIFWLNAAQPLQVAFAELGVKIRPGLVEAAQDVQITAVAEYVAQNPNTLLVLDNLPNPEQLADPLTATLVPEQLPCHLLFTTRRRDVGDYVPLELTTLPEKAALRLLLRHPSRRACLDPSHTEHETARQICRALGYLPLAIKVAGEQLGKMKTAPLTAYVKTLADRGVLTVLEDKRGRRKRLTKRQQDIAVQATLASMYETLGEEPEAQLLLRVAGQLPEAEQIPVARLGLLAGLPAQAEDFFAVTIGQAVQTLADGSLLEQLSAGQVRLHPLVREYTQSLTPPDETAEFRLACAERLAEALWDMPELERQCAERGIDALQRDVLVGLSFVVDKERFQLSKKLESLPANLRADLRDQLDGLLRLLQREAHILRDWDKTEVPHRFVNQMTYRLFDLGLRQKARNVSTWQKRTNWSPRWLAKRESSALVRTLSGHRDDVTSVAITSDGKCAVSASVDTTLKVWNLTTGKEERTLKGHRARVSSVTITPDGKRAVSASHDNTLKVWNLVTGQAECTLEGHRDWVNAVTIMSDGQRVASVSYDRTLRVWNLTSGQAECTLEGHRAIVWSVAISPDGQRAVTASADHTLKVWNLATGQAEYTLSGHGASVKSVAITPDGKQAISISEDNTLKVWNLATGQVSRTFEYLGGLGQSVTITPDGEQAVIIFAERLLKVWSLNTWQAECTLEGHGSRVNSVAITPDGKQAVSASVDNTLKVWNLTTGKEERTLTGHRARVSSVAITPNGNWVVSASFDHTLKVWELSSGQEERSLTGHWSWVNSVAITPDGKRVVSASNDSTLKVWDLISGQEGGVLLGHRVWVSSLTITPDGKRVVSASGDSTLKVWDLATGQEERTLSGHSQQVNSVAIMPDGKRVVSASSDCKLKVWDIDTGELSAEITLEHELISVVVAPDGQTIVAGDEGGNVYCFELRLQERARG